MKTVLVILLLVASLVFAGAAHMAKIDLIGGSVSDRDGNQCLSFIRYVDTSLVVSGMWIDNTRTTQTCQLTIRYQAVSGPDTIMIQASPGDKVFAKLPPGRVEVVFDTSFEPPEWSFTNVDSVSLAMLG